MSVSMQDSIETFFYTNGITFEALGKRARGDLQQEWREVYASQVKAKTGKWILGAEDWLVFARDYSKHLHGVAAEEAYSHIRMVTSQFVVLFSNPQLPGWRCTAKVAPHFSSWVQLMSTVPTFDIYLFSFNHSWTLVITHEEEFGPYFAYNVMQEAP